VTGADLLGVPPAAGGVSGVLAEIPAGWIIWGLAVDTVNLYWTMLVNGTVMKAPLTGGGAAVTLADQQVGPTAIASDGVNVYWATNASIMKMSVTGGTPTTLATGITYDIAVDATSVYWLTRDRVMKVTPK